MKRWCWLLMVLWMSILLTGCITQVWTGVSLLYDRHNVYKKAGDYDLAGRAKHLIFRDRQFKTEDCVVDVAVFNDDVLLAGHVPTEALRHELERRVAHLSSYRHIYNKVRVATLPNQMLRDTWITTEIRTRMIADSMIDPHVFKVVTADGLVYLMGEVKAEQAKRVIQIARDTAGVRGVVVLLKYYSLVSPRALTTT